MTETPMERIIKSTSKALRIPEEIKLPKKKMKRAKPPKYDLSEKNWSKQIDAILTGKNKIKKAKWSDDKHGKDNERSVQKAR